MKIMVSTGPSFGLYCPVVPMAWALRAAGHDVLVAAPQAIEDTVNGSGLPFLPTYGPMHMAEVMAHDRQGQPIAFATEEPQMLEQAGRGFGRLAARVLPGLFEVVDRWQPDLILAEPHAYAAGIVAKVRDLPWVEHGVGLGYFRDMDKAGAVELAPELDALSLSGIPGPDLVLEPCPPSLTSAKLSGLAHAESNGHGNGSIADLPAGLATGPMTVPMRYVQYDPPSPIPAWVFEKRTRPRVLLTLGTVAPAAGGAGVLKELIHALPKLGVEVVVAVADFVVPQLGPLPDAVVAAGFLPLASVMPSCDLVVHHCGGSSTMATILAGLPQLLVPQPIVAEQYDSARRVTAYGSARQLLQQPIDPSAVVENCEALLSDESYRRKAQDLLAEIRSMPSPTELVAEIEALASLGVN